MLPQKVVVAYFFVSFSRLGFPLSICSAWRAGYGGDDDNVGDNNNNNNNNMDDDEDDDGRSGSNPAD